MQFYSRKRNPRVGLRWVKTGTEIETGTETEIEAAHFQPSRVITSKGCNMLFFCANLKARKG